VKGRVKTTEGDRDPGCDSAVIRCGMVRGHAEVPPHGPYRTQEELPVRGWTSFKLHTAHSPAPSQDLYRPTGQRVITAAPGVEPLKYPRLQASLPQQEVASLPHDSRSWSHKPHPLHSRHSEHAAPVKQKPQWVRTE
jgi:hypothetical protein